MDIKVKDKIWHQIDSHIGSLLCTALPSVFEQVAKPAVVPVQPAVPRFGIAQLPSGYHAVQRIKGSETSYFDQYPHELKAAWPDCPDEIVREYTRQFAHRPEVHRSDPKTVALHEAFKKKVLG